MRFDYSGATPLYRQVAEQLSDAIASGAYAEGDQIPSTTEISVTYQLNPATVLKGMNLLVEQGLIEKRRGIGMFVTTGAFQRVRGWWTMPRRWISVSKSWYTPLRRGIDEY